MLLCDFALSPLKELPQTEMRPLKTLKTTWRAMVMMRKESKLKMLNRQDNGVDGKTKKTQRLA